MIRVILMLDVEGVSGLVKSTTSLERNKNFTFRFKS